MSVRRSGLAVFAGLVLLVAAGGAAWACTGQPRVFSVLPASAPEGAQVKVSGEATKANTPISIRWNELEGESLGTAVTGPNGAFAVEVTLPKAAPGIYSLVLTGDVAAGRTAVEISPSPGSGAAKAFAPADAWSASTVSDVPSSQNPSDTGLALGVGFLSFGLVALASAFALGASNRRRVAAPAIGSNR